MYLLHSVINENDIPNILENGYLRSSLETKNIKMTGDKSSKYIYIRLNKEGDYANFYLDKNLLLENIFYLNIGWHSGPMGEKIDGRKLTEEELDIILKNFRARVNRYSREFNKKLTNKKIGNLPVLMTNEILVEKKIPLNKYLRKINKHECNKNDYDFIKKKYKNVKLNCYKMNNDK
jgi:hypothetical protein